MWEHKFQVFLMFTCNANILDFEVGGRWAGPSFWVVSVTWSSFSAENADWELKFYYKLQNVHEFVYHSL